MWNALIVGALCGLAALTRAELALMIPLLAVPEALVARSVASAQRWKLAGVGVLAAAVLVTPWVGYNCDSVYFGDGIGLTDLKCLGPNPRGDQSVDSKIYRERASDYIRDHKKRAVLVGFARVGRTWSLFRPWDMVSYNKGEGREGWVTALGLGVYYPLLVAAVAGWVVMRRRRRRTWPLLVPVLIVTIASAITYGQTRFRVPAEPSIVVLAAVAIAAVVARDWPARPKQRAEPAGS
jgi:4-amino-4-deoxy-L-arabinose transferase-like glycosyltransferase